MEKFKQILKMKIEDETAAFAILGAMIITFAITITAFEYIGSTRLAEVNSNVSMSKINQAEQSSLEDTVANEIENTDESKLNEEEAKAENEKEFEKMKKENKITSAADKYYIKVNYGAQVVTVYTQDSNGKYTKPVRAMICSTGRYTPKSGTYRTLGKGKWWRLMGNVYGQYSTWICGDILFHSVPYLKKGDKSSLEYWAYDQLGQRVSMGCVRLTVKDAKWIYNNCPVGTQVEFYSSSNPGPLGKPTARKISSAPSNVRGWDPTDPDKNNPWPDYLEKLEKEEEKEQEDNKNNNKNDNKNDNKKPTNNTDKTNTIVNNVTNEVANETTGDTATNEITNSVNETTNEVVTNTTDTETNEEEIR